MNLEKAKIEKIDYAPFVRKLHKPIKTASSQIHIRTGYILKIKTSAGDIGFGEASPLENYSSDSIDDVRNFLKRHKLSELLEKYNSKKQKMPSSLVMAIDSALNDTPSFTNSTKAELKSNAMIPIMDHESTKQKIELLWGEGYRHFKFKISHQNKNIFPKLASHIHQKKSYYTIRMDSNSCFSPKEAFLLATRLRRYRIEYWEDPINPATNKKDFLYLKSNLSIPLAIDQELNSLDTLKNFLSENLADYYILKPTCLGGLDNTKEAIRLIKEADKKFVISSALETEVGRRALQKFCLESNPSLAFGLSTGNFFEENFLSDKALITHIEAANANEKLWLENLSWDAIQ